MQVVEVLLCMRASSTQLTLSAAAGHSQADTAATAANLQPISEFDGTAVVVALLMLYMPASLASPTPVQTRRALQKHTGYEA